MPFNKLADIKTVAKYKDILKAELGKLSESRVGYHFFDKVKLDGGSKDGDPFVVMGNYTKTIIDELKAAGGQLKARGAIGEAPGKGLEYTVVHGTLKAATLKSALAEVKTFVVTEASPDEADAGGVKQAAPAQGEVVDTQGGRDDKTPKAAADERRARLKADMDRLRALYDDKQLAATVPEALRGKMAVALKKGFEALKSTDEKAVQAVLGDIAMHLTLFAQAQKLKARKADGVVEDAARASIAESNRVEDAQRNLKDLESGLVSAEKALATAQQDVTNALRSLGADKLQPGQEVRETAHLKKVRAALVVAQDEAADVKRKLAAASQVLVDSPDRSKKLLTQWTRLAGQLEALEAEAKKMFARLGLEQAPASVGKIKDAPGLQAARSALDQKMSAVGDSKRQLAEMLRWHEAESARLRSEHAALGKRVQALAGKALADSLVQAYESEVGALKGRFDAGPDAKELGRDDALRKQAAAADAWLKTRSDQVGQAEKADVVKKLAAHLAAPWGAADQAMKKAKADLDEELAGAAAANPGKVQALLKQLATAGTPSWDGQWTQKQQAILKKLAGKPVPFDDMPGWARRAFLAKRDKIDGKAIDKAIGEVEKAILIELKARMKSLLSEMREAFAELNATARQRVTVELGRQIDNTKDLQAALDSLVDFRRSVAWDFEEALAVQMKQAHDAQELQRRPTRAQWMAHFGIENNRYKVVKSNRVFEYGGATYGTHFTISYDSVTAAQPRIYQASSASVLQAAFVAGVPTVLQAHATIEFPNAEDNPHLYLSGNIHPKGLVGDDIARANAVLTAVRNELLVWLENEIKEFQKTIH
jgi:hypothetical protein